MRRSFSFGWVVMLSVLAGCGDGEMAPEGPLVASIQSGNGQTAGVGAVLPNPVEVRVSRDGSGVAGVAVDWTVMSGGGSVASATSTTAANGTASAVWTLGQAAGSNSLRAAVSGANGSPLTFNATATSGGPPMQAAVSVMDNFFDPTSAPLAAGGTVTWSWAGSGTVTHNVTFSTGTSSSTQSSGTFARTFPDEGSFDYLCTIHGASMSGTIVVQAP